MQSIKRVKLFNYEIKSKILPLRRSMESSNGSMLAVLDIGAHMNFDEVAKVAKLHSQVVAGYFVHLDVSFLDIFSTRTDENSVSIFYRLKKKGSINEVERHVPVVQALQ